MDYILRYVHAATQLISFKHKDRVTKRPFRRGIQLFFNNTQFL